MTNEITQFKYEQLDDSTADFLRQKESNMRQIVGKAYTELGKELYEAQQELANNRNGVFDKWCEYLGFKKRTAHNLIDRYKLIVQNLHDNSAADLIEELPVSLTYEIAKPSAESTSEKAQAKTEVLAGDIATLKEYRERIKELEKKAEAEKAERERLERANEELAKAAGKPPEVVTEYIEVKDEEAERKVQRYEELFGDVSIYEGRTTRITNGDAITYTVFEFSEDVRKFIEKYGHLTYFVNEFNDMIGEGKEEYRKAINSMFRFMEEIERNLDEEDVIIINE